MGGIGLSAGQEQAQAIIDEVIANANAAITTANAAISAISAAIGTYPKMTDFNNSIDDITATWLHTPHAIVPGVTNPTGGAPSRPSISYPAPPAKPSYTVPTVPSLSPIVVPSPPGMQTPSMIYATMGNMLTLSIPGAPSISIPDLTIADPDPLTVDPPTWSFSVEDILASDNEAVIAAIARLKDNIEKGGTGLTEAAEDAIWNRDLERMNQQLEDSTDKVLSMWAKKGFSLPDGLLAHSLMELQKDHANKLLDRSRDITIKQADLEQTNLFKSIELSVNLAFKLVEEMSRYQELHLRVQENTAKFFNEYLELKIKAHNDIVEVFKVRVAAYESTVRAQLAKAEIYKAQIEGELAKAGVNEAIAKQFLAETEAYVSSYKGVVEGNKSLADMYSAQVQGCLTQSQVNESLVKAYVAQIQANGTLIDAYKAEVEAMTAQIMAEKTKIDAYTAEVGGWAKGWEAHVASMNVGIESYKAYSVYNLGAVGLSKDFQVARVNRDIEKAKIGVLEAETIYKSLTGEIEVKLNAAKATAQAAASMAAGAMAALSAHAGITSSTTETITG